MSWIADTIAAGGVWGVGALMFVETVFPPIPSEVIMPLAGVAAARGQMSLGGAIAAGTAGAMAGNFLFYVAARWLGARRLNALVDRYGRWLTVDHASVDRARDWFRRTGPLVVGFGRCVPGIRSLVSVPAGLAAMPPLSFLLWSTLGTSVWSGGLTYVGYRLGQSGLPLVEELLGPVSNGLLALALLIYVYRLATWRKS